MSSISRHFCTLLSQVWKWATGEAVNQRRAGRNCECLQAGMARGRGALFLPGGFSPLCGQWDNREKEGGGKRPPSSVGEDDKRGRKGMKGKWEEQMKDEQKETVIVTGNFVQQFIHCLAQSSRTALSRKMLLLFPFDKQGGRDSERLSDSERWSDLPRFRHCGSQIKAKEAETGGRGVYGCRS